MFAAAERRPAASCPNFSLSRFQQSGSMKSERPVAERERLRARIREAGLRCTAARLAVLGVLSRAARPLSHADCAAKLDSAGFDRTTVYRNLVELAEAALVARVDLG